MYSLSQIAFLDGKEFFLNLRLTCILRSYFPQLSPKDTLGFLCHARQNASSLYALPSSKASSSPLGVPYGIIPLLGSRISSSLLGLF